MTSRSSHIAFTTETLTPQKSLSEALSVQKAEDLEVSFYRDASHALEVSKITGDLIALLLGVKVTHAFRSDMTLLEFVEAGAERRCNFCRNSLGKKRKT